MVLFFMKTYYLKGLISLFQKVAPSGTRMLQAMLGQISDSQTSGHAGTRPGSKIRKVEAAHWGRRLPVLDSRFDAEFCFSNFHSSQILTRASKLFSKREARIKKEQPRFFCTGRELHKDLLLNLGRIQLEM